MSTHNIVVFVFVFIEDLTKICFQLSSNKKLAASKAFSIPPAKCRSKSGKIVKNYFFSIKLLHAHLQYICNIPIMH